MTLLQLVVLAIIQGITEFLPISSSAHLILAPVVVDGWADQGPLIDIAAHVGSLAAVLLYFRTETAMLFRGGVDTLRFKPSDDRKLFLFIAAATIPTLALAAVFVLLDITDALRSPVVIGWTSIIFGALLWHGDRSKGTREGLDNITWRDALSIGLAQMVALVPGVSRSGITMTMARYLGLARPEAARFSMLLAIPTILALGFFAAIEIVREGAGATMASAAIVAVLSFVCAYAAIAALMRLTRSVSFTPFVIYRIIFGVALLAMAGSLAAQ
ncbi:undecaprenyl-diphosphate phosphatase [Hyphococcus luteus]|uniref:Undecaprenyl-diphosphatase n=1 Tax=Hyphococcus luteus TaxID=2058213 RepID=A0A2S7KA94_9PROT|nr:undecaprenyl-diphosphate phosphatase [Marinicaulis flavus]PQA89436.1 undecaprenyl-diphosphate phosphatase [Marinicaulis flavus]